MDLSGKHIVIIITGGIAAYKTLELIRLYKKAQASVGVVMTQNATQFVTPMSVAALSGQAPRIDMWDPRESIQHIHTARAADLIVVAPATANIIAKMATGLADDLASSTLLAASCPVCVAPAMNVHMWHHPATQANIETLRARGISVWGPAAGAMACAETGEGRMLEAHELFDLTLRQIGSFLPLKGLRALVTSGPTFEPIDPVRFIGNRSSGKQGHAIAAALARLGADVTLVAGPCALADPPGVRVQHIETARQMRDACLDALPVDVAICAAAVADWRPVTEADQKIKKDGSAPVIGLTENPDILAALAAPSDKRPRLVVGFAAETEQVATFAAAKFERKGCDWILANQVGAGQGFAVDDNDVTLIRRGADGALVLDPWGPASKQAIAGRLADAIAAFLIPNPKTKDA